jgi:hypothetical protein
LDRWIVGGVFVEPLRPLIRAPRAKARAAACSLLAAALAGATGCSTSQAETYWQRFDRSVSNAVSRASHRLGILPQPRVMWARSAVRVRSGPGLDHDVIGALAYGESIPVLAETDGWVRVRYGRREGWVAGDYVTAVRPAGAGSTAVARTGEPDARKPATSAGDRSPKKGRSAAGEPPDGSAEAAVASHLAMPAVAGAGD